MQSFAELDAASPEVYAGVSCRGPAPAGDRPDSDAEPMRKKRTTLKDIAEAAGLHVSTVSRALDPNMRQFISDEVVNRVVAIAKQMDYRPNRMAHGLRTNRSMTTGVVLPDISNVIFPPIVRGVESVLEPRGYASLIVNTDNSERRKERLVDMLLARGVDGVIHAAASLDDRAALELEKHGIPVVTVNRSVENSSIPYVVNDEADGIEQLMAHVHGLGHRTIAHIAGPQGTSTGYHRLLAFGESSERRGDLGWRNRVAYAGAFTHEEGRRCMSELLARDIPLTAVIAANDTLALGAIEALRAHGLSCPEDVSVAGFNDMPFLELIPPALTTVRIEQFAAGVAAAEMLLKLMGEQEVEPGVVLPVRLVVRASTAAPSRKGEEAGGRGWLATPEPAAADTGAAGQRRSRRGSSSKRA